MSNLSTHQGPSLVDDSKTLQGYDALVRLTRRGIMESTRADSTQGGGFEPTCELFARQLSHALPAWEEGQGGVGFGRLLRGREGVLPLHQPHARECQVTPIRYNRVSCAADVSSLPIELLGAGGETLTNEGSTQSRECGL